MWFDRLEVLGSAEQSEQDGVGHKVEAGEGVPLVVKVTHQRLEAELQLLPDVT